VKGGTKEKIKILLINWQKLRAYKGICMIISHKHKFIFIKTEKTAGTSFEIALSKICGPDDIITPLAKRDEDYRKSLGIRGCQNYQFPLSDYTKKDWYFFLRNRQRLGFYNHISATEIQQHIPQNNWNSYYKFCFERNPFDKFLSWYYWSGKDEKLPSIAEFIAQGRAGLVKGFDLYSSGGAPIVNKVYRFEEMDAALEDLSIKLNLAEKISLPAEKLKGHTRKTSKHYSEILSKEEAEMLSKIFAREIAFFDYRF